MTKIIPFRSKKEIEKKKREKIWEEWLEWEHFEEQAMKYFENQENDEVLNFDDPDNVDEHFITQEDMDFITQEEQIARKEMMRNKDDQTEGTLNISPAEWEWLKEWSEQKK